MLLAGAPVTGCHQQPDRTETDGHHDVRHRRGQGPGQRDERHRARTDGGALLTLDHRVVLALEPQQEADRSGDQERLDPGVHMALLGSLTGGRRGIRTHGGPEDLNSFRDCPIRPLWQPSVDHVTAWAWPATTDRARLGAARPKGVRRGDEVRTVCAVTALDDVATTGSGTTVWDRLGIDPAEPHPAWAVLDAVRAVSFSGEVTMHLPEPVRLHSSRGRIYWAERCSDDDVVDRLVALGALTADEAISGTVLLGDVVHIGGLFRLLPGLDVERIRTAVDYLRDSTVATVADVEVIELELVEHQHHPSGMVLWELDLDDLPGRRTPFGPATVAAEPQVAGDVQMAVRLALDEIRAALRDDIRSHGRPSGPNDRADG